MSELFRREDYADAEYYESECQRFSWLTADTTFHEISRFWSKVYGHNMTLADADGNETLAEYAKRTGQSVSDAAKYAADDLLWDPATWIPTPPAPGC